MGNVAVAEIASVASNALAALNSQSIGLALAIGVPSIAHVIRNVSALTTVLAARKKPGREPIRNSKTSVDAETNAAPVVPAAPVALTVGAAPRTRAATAPRAPVIASIIAPVAPSASAVPNSCPMEPVCAIGDAGVGQPASANANAARRTRRWSVRKRVTRRTKWKPSSVNVDPNADVAHNADVVLNANVLK